ncbi:uncharacterized protein [Rhodnius prolixus]|uniref:uncharacterized protein n=1 Tax=Rhodnius prolixus TaxID=13249 RepID=UPI003D18CC64
MLQPGKMVEVADEILKYKIDVVALQEIRWSGHGRVDKKAYSLFYSGAKKAGQSGTGFMITKEMRRNLLLFEPISDRLCKMRLKGRFRNLTIISAYAPTENSDEDEKSSFYLQLERSLQAAPRYDTKIILGDLNAQVGKESFTRTVAGTHSLHDLTNENGMHLCQFAEANDMIIKSTFFPHRKIHTATWKAPNGSLTQIDHVLISRRHSSSIIDVRSARGPNCDSDHILVKIKLRQRLAKVAQGQSHLRKRWNLQKFKDPEKLEEFRVVCDNKVRNELRQGKDENRFENDDGDQRIQRNWNIIKKAIHEAADEVIGEEVRRKNADWFDDECREALKKRNEYRLSMMQRNTRQSTSDYNRYRARAKKIIRSKKRALLRKEVEQIEEMRANNETRKFYGAIKFINRGFQPRVDTCRDKLGRIIEEKSKVVDRWAEYYGEMLGSKRGVVEGVNENENENENENDNVAEVNIVLSDENDLEPPDMEDFLDAVERLKSNKAPGEDCLVAEFFKNGGEILLNQLYSLVLDIWKDEIMPRE